MRKKGSYRKNKLFCLLAAAALRFVQSYLNDIDTWEYIEKRTRYRAILYPVRCKLFNLSDSNAHRHYNLDAE